mmetsp:Transcript_88985/g.237321  ORF Transcript_88985/g.237321 Transcript_88985/m.237321 type:complete len:227 (-) Transcript_88985:1001-1681(-)
MTSTDAQKADVQIQVDGPVHWHSKGVDQVLRELETYVVGLSDAEAAARIEKFGRNEMTPPPKKTFWMKLWNQINNVLIYILLVAAIVSGILQEWAETGLIVAVISLNVTIGLLQEGKAEKAADAIKSMLSPKAIVIRDGHQMEVAGVMISKPDRIPKLIPLTAFAFPGRSCARRLGGHQSRRLGGRRPPHNRVLQPQDPRGPPDRREQPREQSGRGHRRRRRGGLG